MSERAAIVKLQDDGAWVAIIYRATETARFMAQEQALEWVVLGDAELVTVTDAEGNQFEWDESSQQFIGPK